MLCVKILACWNIIQNWNYRTLATPTRTIVKTSLDFFRYFNVLHIKIDIQFYIFNLVLADVMSFSLVSLTQLFVDMSRALQNVDISSALSERWLKSG